MLTEEQFAALAAVRKTIYAVLDDDIACQLLAAGVVERASIDPEPEEGIAVNVNVLGKSILNAGFVYEGASPSEAIGDGKEAIGETQEADRISRRRR